MKKLYKKTALIEIVQEYPEGYIVQNENQAFHRWTISKEYLEKYYTEVKDETYNLYS